jgi:hypothetical protein
LGSNIGTLQRVGIALAALYMAALVCLYFYIPFGDPGFQYGGIGLVLYTLPLSLAGQFVAGLAAMVAPNYIGEAMTFFVLVVLCGGANAYLLMRLFRYKLGRNGVRIVVATGAIFAVVVQTTAAQRAKAAMDYHWPTNVPKTAFLVPNWSGGWFQQCAYDAVSQTDHCRIWNFRGLILYNEQFVPYDAGAAAPTDQLVIVDRGSGPDRVTLKNGRILIPKSREADLRRFLDRSN